jgi:hypothetical protein
MAAEPVNGWDSRVIAASETAFGTTPSPSASDAIEAISCSTGASGEVGRTRPKQDRNVGRGHTNAFVEGRVDPIAIELSTSVKSRSAVDTAAKEVALYKAAGLSQTLNGSTNATYALQADPIASAGGAASYPGLSLFRGLGPAAARYQAEQVRGGVIRQLVWDGGDKELMLKASGVGIGKYNLGEVDSITLANGVGTSLSLTAEQSYRIGPGYYQVESEVILVQGGQTDVGATTRTIARAQLATSGAAHAAKQMYPYMTSLTYVGSPISEANCTFTLDSVAMRALSATVTFDTGMDLLPGETGSKNAQGVKAGRYKLGVAIKSVLHREETAWLGKVTARKSVALSLVFGTGTGGIATFSFPQCEIRPIVVPDTANDVSIVNISVEPRDSSSGNDAFSLVLT